MATRKSPKMRSPNYPAFSLKEAVNKAELFFQRQKLNYVSADAACESMGIKYKTGTGLRFIATMVQYGLLEDRGKGKNREVRLSDLGYKIISLEPETNPERLQAIAKAALLPKMHIDMMKKFTDGIPSLEAMRSYLVANKKFNPDTVSKFIKEWSETFEFANLGEHGNISEDAEQDGETQDNIPERNLKQGKANVTGTAEVKANPIVKSGQPTSAPTGATVDFSFPVTGGKKATLLFQGGKPTKEDCKILKQFLDIAMHYIEAPTNQINSDSPVSEDHEPK